MAINFMDAETTLVSNKEALTDKIVGLSKGKKIATIPSSKDVTGIELRMLPPFIKDNGTTPVFPFPGFARLYCLTIVVSDIDNQLAGNIDLKGFQRIGDREHLPINKTIFYWQGKKASDNGPGQIHTMCSVMKSKQSLREAGEVLSKVKADANYKDLTNTLKSLAAGASKLNIVTDIVTQIASIVGGYLGKVEDKPLGTLINSYTTLHGDFDNPGITPLSYPTRNIDFDFQMVVRKATTPVARSGAINIKGAASPGKKSGNALIMNGDEEVEVDMSAL